jgi:hypothetical protein
LNMCFGAVEKMAFSRTLRKQSLDDGYALPIKFIQSQ